MNKKLNIPTQNSDEMTEMIEYRKVYKFVKIVAPMYFVITFALFIKNLYDPNYYVHNFSGDMVGIIALAVFVGFCLSSYLFKIMNLLRFLFTALIMAMVALLLGFIIPIYGLAIFNPLGFNPDLIAFILVAISILIGAGVNILIQMRGTYSFITTKE